MSSLEWKWLLQQLDDQELARLAHNFAQVSPALEWQPKGCELGSHSHPPRARAIASFCLPRLRKAVNRQMQGNQDLLVFRSLSETELEQQLLAGTNPKPMIMSLLSSPSQASQLSANRLFRKLSASGKLDAWLVAERSSPGQCTLTPEQLLLQRRLTTLEDVAEKLKQRVVDLEAELVEQATSSSRSQRLWERERQALLSRLAERETKLQAKEQQLKLLLHPEHDQVRGQVQLPVALIISSLEIPLAEVSKRYSVSQITPDAVSQGLATEVTSQAAEVWLLASATPIPVQRQLRRDIPEKLRTFASFDALLAFASQTEEG